MISPARAGQRDVRQRAAASEVPGEVARLDLVEIECGSPESRRAIRRRGGAARP